MREINIYKMDIGTRDKYIMQIERQVHAKKTLLLKKRQGLTLANKQNKYLEGVRDDYRKYHKYIIEQKQSQINQMNTLSKYIDQIIKNNKLTDKDLLEARDEQNTILREIQGVKLDLNTLVAER